MFVTIDPGTDSGWALYNPGRLIAIHGLPVPKGLVACGLGDPRDSELHIVDHIDSVFIERTRIRPHEKSPNDILECMLRAGEWRGVYACLAIDACYVPVEQWKGSQPKAVHHPKIWAKLTPLEQEVFNAGCKGVAPSKRHNAIDAVGLALWVAKR